jgi:hypothetical protein
MNRYVPDRKVGDFDAFTNESVVLGGDHRADLFWHDSLLEWWDNDTDRFATLNELYTIKVSHAYWEPRTWAPDTWDKHMSDVVKLKQAGAHLVLELHGLLYKIWEEKYGKKIIDLNMDKSAFFDDAVPRTYDHDSVHYSVAYGELPIWESVLREGEEIAMDMAKIKALPFETQVKLYREEIYATALERWVIPRNYRISPRLAYAWAVKKTIISLTKGWSARFLVENYDTFRDPDMNYVAHHKTKLDQLIRL